MLWTIIVTVIVGAIIGALARLVLPGKQNISTLVTVVLAKAFTGGRGQTGAEAAPAAGPGDGAKSLAAAAR